MPEAIFHEGTKLRRGAARSKARELTHMGRVIASTMKRRLISWALLALTTALTITLSGCSTVKTRIEERPEAFYRLRTGDQALVTQGRIREGLSQDAVYIAWGAPNQRAEGRNRGSAVETWIYFNTTASDYYPGYGYGYGGLGYGGFGYGYGGFGYGSGFGYGGGFGHRHHGRGGRYGGYYYDPFFDPFFYNRTSVISYPDRTVSFQNGRVIAYQYLPVPRFY